MSFGYNATPAFENTTAGIVEHARTLLTALIEIREGDNVSVDFILTAHRCFTAVSYCLLLLPAAESRSNLHPGLLHLVAVWIPLIWARLRLLETINRNQ